MMAFKKLSLLLPQPRVAHARLGSVSSRSTPRTVISFTSFCPLLVINARTITGARSRIEPDFVVKSLRQFDPNGRRNCRYFCAFRRRTGVDDGWNINESVKLAGELKQTGVDLIDCSSGGNVPHAKIPAGPGYQTHFAERIRREAGIMTGAVGMITSPVQAEHIIRTEQADAVIIAREFLRDPYWPLRAARELDQPIAWPVQYLRAAPKGAQPRIPVDLKSFESCFEEQHGVPEQ